MIEWEITYLFFLCITAASNSSDDIKMNTLAVTLQQSSAVSQAIYGNIIYLTETKLSLLWWIFVIYTFLDWNFIAYIYLRM